MDHYKLVFEKRTLYAVDLPRLIFHLKNVTYEEELVDSTARTNELENEKFYGVLQLLVDGKVVAKQQGISSFLAQQFDLVGETRKEEKTCKKFMCMVSDLLGCLRGYLTHELEVQKQISREFADELVPRFLDVLEEHLQNSKFSSGYLASEKLTWCDLGVVLLFVIYRRFKTKENFLDYYPLLKAFEKRVVSIPVVKDYINQGFGLCFAADEMKFSQAFPNQTEEELPKNKKKELKEEGKKLHEKKQEESLNVKQVMTTNEAESLHDEEKSLIIKKVTTINEEEKSHEKKKKELHKKIEEEMEEEIIIYEEEELNETIEKERESLNIEGEMTCNEDEKLHEKGEEESLNMEGEEMTGYEVEKFHEVIEEENLIIKEEITGIKEEALVHQKKDKSFPSELEEVEFLPKKGEEFPNQSEKETPYKKELHDEKPEEIMTYVGDEVAGFPCKIEKEEQLPHGSLPTKDEEELMDLN